MSNMNYLMKQAQALQEKLTKTQTELANKTFTGNAGGGMVIATISGKGEAQSIKLDPSLLNKEDVEMLEDLIVTAFKNAKNKLDEETESNMSSLLPPGFKMPF